MNRQAWWKGTEQSPGSPDENNTVKAIGLDLGGPGAMLKILSHRQWEPLTMSE